MLVSWSAQAPAAGVAGPAQPTEVRLRARVSLIFPPALLQLIRPWGRE